MRYLQIYHCMFPPRFKPPFFKSHTFPLYCSFVFVSIFKFLLYISYPIVFITKQLSLLSPPLHLRIKVKSMFTSVKPISTLVNPMWRSKGGHASVKRAQVNGDLRDGKLVIQKEMIARQTKVLKPKHTCWFKWRSRNL